MYLFLNRIFHLMIVIVWLYYHSNELGMPSVDSSKMSWKNRMLNNMFMNLLKRQLFVGKKGNSLNAKS